MNEALQAGTAAVDAVAEHALPQRLNREPAGEMAERAPVRVLVISLAAFQWLRELQHTAPAPRLDMRYHLEGVARVLEERGRLHQAWLDHSRNAMFQHLAQLQQQQEHQEAGHGPSRTADRLQDGEGAHARTSHMPAKGPSEQRLADSKALQLGEHAFQWLKGIQGTTRAPRIEIRYLIDGAFVLLQQQQNLLPAVVEHARQALAEHLAVLRATPVRPILMEHKQ